MAGLGPRPGSWYKAADSEISVRNSPTKPRIPRSPMAFAAMAGVAPFVIGARMAALMLDAESVRTRAEARRMVGEKIAASSQAATEAAFQMARQGLSMWRAFALGRMPDMVGAADRTASRVTAPHARRVHANARRLSSRRTG
jgi:hypothetical protein